MMFMKQPALKAALKLGVEDSTKEADVESMYCAIFPKWKIY